MGRPLHGGVVRTGGWKLVELGAGESAGTAKLPFGEILVPLSVWKARKSELIRREWDHGTPLGVWLGANDDVSDVAADIDDFSAIAIDFRSSREGHASSVAASLRARYSFHGQLLAILDDAHRRSTRLGQLDFDASILIRDDETAKPPTDVVELNSATQPACA